MYEEPRLVSPVECGGLDDGLTLSPRPARASRALGDGARSVFQSTVRARSSQ